MTSSKKGPSEDGSKERWVCPGQPRCKNWEKKACKHLEREMPPLYAGAMPIAPRGSQDIVDELEDEEPLLPAQERRRLWEFLGQFEGVTTKQKHVLTRRLVDEATFKDIGKDLGIGANRAFEIYRRALNRVKAAWEKYERT
jgi:hypothetical protein